MRGTRWLLLFAILAVLGAVGGTYHFKRQAQEREAPPPPKTLPSNVKAESDRWVYAYTEGERQTAVVSAAKMRQVDDPAKVDLEEVEIHIYDPDGKAYDQVKSAYASFDTETGDLYSDGEVEIVLGVPADHSPPQDPVIIRSSGVRFDVQSGKATTERAANFVFGPGDGSSIGATYEPDYGDLRMHRDAVLHWRGSGAPMKIEAGELVYKEDHSIVYLSPWSRFQRGALTLEADNSAIIIENGAIRVVDAHAAHGTSQHNGRRLKYSASFLTMRFDEDGVMEQIVGREGASLSSASEASETTVTADEIFLDFQTRDGDSILVAAYAKRGAVLESKPLIKQTETRVMRSESLKIMMREDGREIAMLETLAPGSVEFLPNLPQQRRRRLDGERLSMQFSDGNQIESFRGIQVATRTDPLPQEGKEAPPSRTWSDGLVAKFDPASGEMVELQQWGRFRYQKGDRQAKADKGVFDSAGNTMRLTGKARVWDPQGSTSANLIELDQANDRFSAIGEVSSTRLPDAQPDSSGGLLAPNEAVHATAHRMETTDSNRKIVYEGKAVLWQGSSRLEAHRVDIERESGTLTARGKVLSRFAEESKDKSQTEFTVVRANQLVYSDEQRLAHYTGSVSLERQEMEVEASELQAFFRKNGESGLDRAVADGQVKIVHQTEERTRTGTAEHANYHLDEEKVILSGGIARLVDSLKGATEGRQLTYYSRDDRLLIEGAEAQPSASRLRRR